MKLVTTTPVKTTTGKDIAAGQEFDEPDDARAEFWLRTGACVKPGSPRAAIAIQAAKDGTPFDLASGAVKVEDLLSHRVGIDGVDLKKLREQRGITAPQTPADRLPPVPPLHDDDAKE